MHSADHTAAEPSVKEYNTAFPSTGHLLTVWSYKYEHRSSENIMHFCLDFLVCYSDAGSALPKPLHSPVMGKLGPSRPVSCRDLIQP